MGEMLGISSWNLNSWNRLEQAGTGWNRLKHRKTAPISDEKEWICLELEVNMVNGRSIQISRHPKSSAWDSVCLVGPQIAPSEVAYVDRLFKHQNSEDVQMSGSHQFFFSRGNSHLPGSRLAVCWKSPAESCCLTSSEHSLEKHGKAWKSMEKQEKTILACHFAITFSYLSKLGRFPHGATRRENALKVSSATWFGGAQAHPAKNMRRLAEVLDTHCILSDVLNPICLMVNSHPCLKNSEDNSWGWFITVIMGFIELCL